MFFFLMLGFNLSALAWPGKQLLKKVSRECKIHLLLIWIIIYMLEATPSPKAMHKFPRFLHTNLVFPTYGIFIKLSAECSWDVKNANHWWNRVKEPKGVITRVSGSVISQRTKSESFQRQTAAAHMSLTPSSVQSVEQLFKHRQTWMRAVFT